MATRKRPPATTPEAREQQLIAAAVDLVERQIADGTVSAQVLSHYVKQASPTAELQNEKLRQENELLKARVKQIEDAGNMALLVKDALDAMQSYKGEEVYMPVDDDED